MYLIYFNNNKKFNNFSKLNKKLIFLKNNFNFGNSSNKVISWSDKISFLEDNIRNRKNKNFFLKTKLPVFFIKKIIRELVDLNFCYNMIFFLSNYIIFKKKLRLMSYLNFFKIQIIENFKNENKNLIIQIKKKNNNYFFFLIINGKIVLTTSIGVALRFTGLKRKFLKKKIKSFSVILSIIKKLYKYFFKKDFFKNFIIDFLDKRIYYFNKILESFIKSSNLFFLNLKTNFGKNNFKKVKSIKKNSRKKILLLFLEDLKKFNFKNIKRKKLLDKSIKK